MWAKQIPSVQDIVYKTGHLPKAVLSAQKPIYKKVFI